MLKSDNHLRYHLIFVLIVIFSVVLRVSYYMGPSGADDIIYFSVIEKLLLNEDVGTAISSFKHWGVRLGLIFPVWAFMKLFGVSEFSSYLFPMILSTGTLVFIYIVGIRLFNPAIALLSSAIFALLPQDVYLSGVIYPDGPVVLFGTIFIYLFYRVSLREDVVVKDALIAGLILGIGYYVRETALILLITIPILFFRAPQKKNFCKSVAFVIAGLLIAVALEMAVMWLLTGDPLTRYKILIGESKVLAPREFTSWGPNYSQTKNEYNKYLFEPLVVIFATHWISPVMILIAVGIPALLITKRNNGIFSSWNGHFLWLFILTFGVLAYYAYGPIYGLTVPLKRSTRYYHIITPFASLILGVILYEFLSQRNYKRIIGYLMVFFYIFISFVCLGSIINKNSDGIDLIDEFIAQNPAENYIMPVMLKKTLQLKHGISFLEDKIVGYKYKGKYRRNLFANVRKDGTTQYFFDIPKIQELQIGFSRHIKWPMERLRLVTVMSTTPSMSCRLLKSSDAVFRMVPGLFKSKICYTTDVYVYRLK